MATTKSKWNELDAEQKFKWAEVMCNLTDKEFVSLVKDEIEFDPFDALPMSRILQIIKEGHI